MYQCLQDVVNALEGLKRHTPLALHTAASLAEEAALHDAVNAAIAWIEFLGEWADQVPRVIRQERDERARREHAAWCARERAARLAREEAVWEYKASRDDAAADPAGVIAEYIALTEPRPGHRSPVRYTVRVRGVAPHVGPRAPLPLAEREEGPRLAPRYLRAFDRLGEHPGPAVDHGFGGEADPWLREFDPDQGLEDERPATEFLELRGRERLEYADEIDEHAPDQVCPRCRRGPALCECGNPVDLDEGREHYAFGRLARLEETAATVERAIRALECRRSSSPFEELERLRAIRDLEATVARGYEDVDARGRAVWRKSVLEQIGEERWRLAGPKCREYRDGAWRDRPGARPWDPGDYDQFGDAPPAAVREKKFAVDYAGFARDDRELPELALDALHATRGHRAARVA